jgi:hypothetical protein
MLRFITTFIVCLSALPAQAALLGRSALTPGGTDYQAYYDDSLNITWVADAALSETSGYTAALPSTRMTFAETLGWITSLNDASYLGATNWRLPTTTQPDPTCSAQTGSAGSVPFSGYATGCSGSEMGHLYNVTGISAYGTLPGPLPFTNVRRNPYWSSTTYGTNGVWTFDFYDGYQLAYQPISRISAWAVRDGDIGVVPVPAAAWLFCSALGVMGAMRRKASINSAGSKV